MLITALQSVTPATVDWVKPLLAVIIFIVGGGTVGKWLANKVRQGHIAETTRILSDTFAKKSDIDGLRSSLQLDIQGLRQSLEFAMKDCQHTASGAAALAEMASQTSDKALTKAERVQTVQDQFQQRIIDDVMVPIREMSTKQAEQGEVLAAQTALLKRLTEQVDRKL